ncbi:MAG: hypothetical protein ACFFEF_07890 [Candidatus Thorarchaeota archaeon]
MATRREYFKEPIVRIGIEDARFPRSCPVCGADGEHITRIWASPHKMGNPRYPKRTSPRIGSKGTKALLVYVCDEHHQSDEGSDNSRIACTVGNGLMVALLLFAILNAGGDIWAGRPINPIFFVVVFLFVIVIALSIAAFKPGPLERSIRVVGFDLGFQNMWLQFKRPEYRDQFLEENALKAELVRWISKL